jgi:hypothetical protein
MKPIEGTFILEGLVQGPVPDVRDGTELLQRFAADIVRNHLPLNLELTGGQFSLLADGQPHPGSDFHPQPVPDCIQQVLGQLLALLPPQDRSRVISTLRSREFQPGTVQQTLYSIVAPGQVQVQTRESPADVILQCSVRSQLMKRRLMIGGLTVLALGIVATVVDFKPWLHRVGTRLKLQPPAVVPVDATALAEGISATATAGETLEITLTRGPQWDTLLQTSPAEPDWTKHLASTALHRGYALVILLDATGKALRSQVMDLEPLRSAHTCIVSIPLAKYEVVSAVKVRP